MRQRFEYGLLVLLLIALAYVAASWYLGLRTQDMVQQWVSQANQQLQADTHAPQTDLLTINTYERGIFSSQATYSYVNRAHDLEFVFAGQTFHGPWPWSQVTAGKFKPLLASTKVVPVDSAGWSDWFKLQEQGQLPWQLAATVDFNGDVDGVLGVAPVRLQRQGLNLAGAELKIGYLAHQRQTLLAGVWPNISVKQAADGFELAIKNASIEFAGTYADASSLSMHYRLGLEHVKIITPQAPELSLQGAAINFDSARSGALLDSRLRYDFGQAKMGAAALGHLQVQASASQFDVNALQDLSLLLAELGQQQGLDKPISPQETAALRAIMGPLFATSPRLAIDAVTWQTSAGTSELKAAAQFKPLPDAAAVDPAGALQQAIAKLSLDFSISKPMVLGLVANLNQSANAQQAQALASMLFDSVAAQYQRAGLLRIDGERLLGQYQYQDGQLSINGKALTAQELAALLATAAGMVNN